MPLFFIVSGYLYKYRVINKEFIFKKIKSLLLPYVFFGVSYCLLFLFVYGGELLDKLKAVLLISVSGLPYESALWFLIVMFETVIGYLFIDNIIKNTWLRRCAIGLIMIVGLVWKLLIPIGLPWGFHVTFVALGFYELGRSVRELCLKRAHIISAKKQFFLLVLVAWILIVSINGQMNMRTSTYNMIPLSIVGALLGTYLVYCVAFVLSKTVLSTILINISQWGVLFLSTNHVVLGIVGQITELPIGIPFRGVLQYAFTGLVSIGIMYILTFLIYKTPMKIVFGK